MSVISSPHSSSSPDSRRPPGPLVVVAPHLDDAVFSCGGLLGAHPGSIVVTVYTGLPECPDTSTDWDRRCGFASAAEALERRQTEDHRALQLTASTGLCLDFIDAQYRQGAPESLPRLADSLLHVLAGVSAGKVALPLGLFHDDHLNVSDAGLRVGRICPGISWFLYEDVPYRARAGAVQARLDQLRGRGIATTPVQLESNLAIKPEAILAYASQLRGLGGMPATAQQAEGYWRIDGWSA